MAVDGILRRRLLPDDDDPATIYAVLVAFVTVDEYRQLPDAR